MVRSLRLLAFMFFVLSSSALSAQEKGLDRRIDEAFKPFSDFVTNLVFFEVLGTPFVLILLVGSALFFTLYFGFPKSNYMPCKDC